MNPYDYLTLKEQPAPTLVEEKPFFRRFQVFFPSALASGNAAADTVWGDYYQLRSKSLSPAVVLVHGLVIPAPYRVSFWPASWRGWVSAASLFIYRCIPKDLIPWSKHASST